MHWPRLPKFAEKRRRYRVELPDVVPLEINLEAAAHAIVSETPNPGILNRAVFERQRFDEVIAVDDPMSAATVPVSRRCVMINVARLRVMMAASHANIP